jgi:hypothetical protein
MAFLDSDPDLKNLFFSRWRLEAVFQQHFEEKKHHSLYILYFVFLGVRLAFLDPDPDPKNIIFQEMEIGGSLPTAFPLFWIPALFRIIGSCLVVPA